jgi:predicted nucleic acid-binding protein
MVVADASAIIDYLDGTEPLHTRVKELIAQRQLVGAVIARYEILAFASEDSRAAALFRDLPCRGLTIGAEDLAISAGRHLRSIGQTIDAPDTLIAGICLAHGDAILTGNRRHFQRIPGLAIDAASPSVPDEPAPKRRGRRGRAS